MSSAGNRSSTRAEDEGTLHESVTAIADIVRREVRREMGRLRESAGEMVERGRESAERVRENVRGRVRERPLTSVLIAGGIGLLLGMLAARRRSE